MKVRRKESHRLMLAVAQVVLSIGCGFAVADEAASRELLPFYVILTVTRYSRGIASGHACLEVSVL